MNEDSRQTYGEQDDHTTLPRGMRLGPYRIDRVLGRGGFGVTYLARHKETGETVVIKENLPTQFAVRHSITKQVTPQKGKEQAYQWSLDHFLREAELLYTLNHPNIVEVQRSFSALGTAFYVMPWVGGKSLEDIFLGDTAEEKAIAVNKLLRAMLDTLEYLHSKNLLHRDIKPANILVTENGTPVLIDFGTARSSIGKESQTLIESPGYTPFEQIQKRGNMGPWSDLYSLAATMIYLLTGEIPQPAADRQNGGDTYVPLAKRRELKGKYPLPLLDSIDKAFLTNEEKRWQSAGEWLAYLDKSKRKQRCTAPLLCGFGAAALLTAAAALGLNTLPERSTTSGSTIAEAKEDAESLYQQALQEQAKDKERAFELVLRAAELGHEKARHELARCVAEEDIASAKLSSALTLLEKLEQEGDAEARLCLGICYWDGRAGLPRNIDKAEALFRTEAERNHPKAALKLGILIFKDREQQEEGIKWIQRAADLNDSDACYFIGRFFAHNADSPERIESAEKYLSRAAEAGLAEAQTALGAFYETPHAGKKDAKKAIDWYTKAAEQGFAPGQYHLAECYRYGVGAAINYAKAEEWYHRAEMQDDAEATFALAELYLEGRTASADKAKPKSYELFIKSARLGHARGQCYAGDIYANGLTGEKDYALAAEWYEKSARQGYKMGQTYLGELYFHGRVPSAPADLSKAAYWFKEAVAQKEPLAMAYLSQMYYNGLGGLKPDQEKATELMKASAAADCGLGKAMLAFSYEHGGDTGLPKNPAKAVQLYQETLATAPFLSAGRLGHCYQYGIGTDKDEKLAVKCYEVGSEQGDWLSYCYLALCYRDGLCGKQQDKKKAVELLRKARQATRISYASGLLAQAYLDGDGVERNIPEAKAILEEMVAQGHPNGYQTMGILCLNGAPGISIDKNKAFRYLSAGYERKDIASAFFLARCYENGWGTAPSKTKAAELYRFAADRGFAAAQTELGNLYELGEGVEQSDELAFRYYQMAADSGDAYASFYLGLCYHNGTGIERNQHLALKYFLKAAEADIPEAQFNVGLYYLNGYGGAPADETKAKEWFRKAKGNGYEIPDDIRSIL